MLDALFGNVPLLLLTVGLVLMALEALSPGAHLVVIGIALLGAGLIGVLFPPAADVLVLAALTLVIGAVAAYIYNEFDFYGGKGTAQTSDSGSLSGTTGYVTETVSTRGGEVKLDDGGFAPHYSARTTSGTIEEGEEIIVLDPGGGNVLTVEALGAIGEDDIDRALAEGSAESTAESAAESESESETEPNSGSNRDSNPTSTPDVDTQPSDVTDDSVTETEKSG